MHYTSLPKRTNTHLQSLYKSNEELAIDSITKAEKVNALEKGGEGSRGGKVIGHTKSGKPVYADKNADHEDYKDFSTEDHKEAEKLHHSKYLQASEKHGSSWQSNRTGSNSPEYIKAHEHRLIGVSHSKKYED